MLKKLQIVPTCAVTKCDRLKNIGIAEEGKFFEEIRQRNLVLRSFQLERQIIA